VTSEFIGFLSEGKTWKRNGLPVAHHFNAEGRFGFGTRLTQDSKGSQRLVVDFRDEKTLSAGVFLPHLANLDFARSHATTLVTNSPSVNGRGPSM